MDHPCDPRRHIVVIGSGVVGLQTAISLLEADFRVTVIAEHFPGDHALDYTSDWAGAHWRTHASAEETELCEWDVATYNHWMKAINSKDSDLKGIAIRNSRLLWPSLSKEEIPKYQNPWWKNSVRSFKVIPEKELPEGIAAGVSYDSIMVDVPVYLESLMQRVTALGGRVIRDKIPTDIAFLQALSLAENIVCRVEDCSCIGNASGNVYVECLVDGFVNATGLGAGTLVPDKDVYPIRGQTVLVKGESSSITTIENLKSRDNPTISYILPRVGSGRTVLGGTKEVGDWNTQVRNETTNDIISRCKRWAPELLTGPGNSFEVQSVHVGLRPGRKGGPRVECVTVKKPHENGFWSVCHSYGHAGAGYQNSIGSARKVVTLLQKALKSCI